jgi:peptide/nickel transport system permease protein
VALGASPLRIVVRHLIPNALAPVIVAATLAIGDNILTEAGLSFLGLGVQIPTPSWGNMLQDSLTPAVRSAPWLIVTPGLLIVLTLLAFSLISEGLQLALDRSLAPRVADEPAIGAPSVAAAALATEPT